jgi:hypothetical protein
VLTILILFAGISFSASNISEVVIKAGTIDRLLKYNVPRFNHFQFQPGVAELQQVVANKVPIDYYDIPAYALLYSPLLTGLAAGAVFLGLVALIKYFSNRWAAIKGVAYAVFALWFFWGVGILLVPTDLLGNAYKSYDCSENEIAAYEKAGRYLADIIPPGSRIYWNGYSPVNLLYIPDAIVYPPQLNLRYSFSTEGDTDAILRYGWWNDELSGQWLQEVDYVLIEQRYFQRGGEVVDELLSDHYEELPPAPSTAICRDDAYIHIFRRIP